MNDYQDLMNEYQEIKNKITQESVNILNAIVRIKTFLTGIESVQTHMLMIPEQKIKAYENIDKDIVSFSNSLMNIKNAADFEIMAPLNNLLESTNEVCKQSLDKFNDIKVSLIQERQKLNKTKDDYFKFVSKNSNNKYKNEDENILYKTKKENYYQLYKYEVNQMNAIIEENNIKYNTMQNDLWKWKDIQKTKIKNPRFEKVKLEEEYSEKEENNNNVNKIIENKTIKNDIEFETPMGAKSNNIIKT